MMTSNRYLNKGIVYSFIIASRKINKFDRFNDLSLGIISNCESTREIAFNLDSHYSEIESKQQIQQFLSSNIDVIFIDFTNFDSSWSFINELVALGNESYIQCIISPTKIEHKRNSFQTIRPTQSYTMKDGVQVNCINKETELNYSYYHLYSGLKDNSTKYNQDRTGYFKTLAWHFMAEVGHKLGFVPKYGA